ncbi:MAG: ligand-binding sensor domain-containing protein, partial [Lentimonas sp.]
MPVLRLIIFLLLSIPCFSQEMLTWEYNLTHGLPSTTCYTLMESKSGEIWFGSDHGVTRFDGQNFTTYTVKDGLNENTVLECFEDSYGRIWFHHGEKFPSYWQNGVIYKTTGKPGQFINRLSGITQTSDGRVLIGAYEGVYCFNEKGENIFIEINSGFNYDLITNYKGNIIFSGTYLMDSIYVRKGITFKSLTLENQKWLGQTFIFSVSLKRYYDLFISQRNNEAFNSILKTKNIGYVYDVKLYKNNLYIGTNSGLRVYKLKNNKWEIISQKFQNKDVVSIVIKENQVWVSVWGSGLVLLQSHRMTHPVLSDFENATFIKQIDKNLYIGTKYGVLYELNQDSIINTYKLGRIKTRFGQSESDENSIWHVLKTGDSLIVVGKMKAVSINLKKNKVTPLFEKNSGLSTGVYLEKSDEFIYAHHVGIRQMKLVKTKLGVIMQSKFKELSKVRDMAYFRGQLYLATSKGLFKYNNEKVTPVKADVFGEVRINSLHVSGGNLIIGTNTEGLWVYDIVSTKKIELKEGINPDQILLLTPSLGEAFWVLSDGAVQKLYLDNDLLIQIQAIDLRAQIKSTEVTHMTEHENELYILSKDGINTFPAGSSKTLKELKVMPLKMKIDNQLIPISKTIALNVDQSLSFKFASV